MLTSARRRGGGEERERSIDQHKPADRRPATPTRSTDPCSRHTTATTRPFLKISRCGAAKALRLSARRWVRQQYGAVRCCGGSTRASCCAARGGTPTTRSAPTAPRRTSSSSSSSGARRAAVLLLCRCCAAAGTLPARCGGAPQAANFRPSRWMCGSRGHPPAASSTCDVRFGVGSWSGPPPRAYVCLQLCASSLVLWPRRPEAPPPEAAQILARAQCNN